MMYELLTSKTSVENNEIVFDPPEKLLKFIILNRDNCHRFFPKNILMPLSNGYIIFQWSFKCCLLKAFIGKRVLVLCIQVIVFQIQISLD